MGWEVVRSDVVNTLLKIGRFLIMVDFNVGAEGVCPFTGGGDEGVHVAVDGV